MNSMINAMRWFDCQMNQWIIPSRHSVHSILPGGIDSLGRTKHWQLSMGDGFNITVSQTGEGQSRIPDSGACWAHRSTHMDWWWWWLWTTGLAGGDEITVSRVETSDTRCKPQPRVEAHIGVHATQWERVTYCLWTRNRSMCVACWTAIETRSDALTDRPTGKTHGHPMTDRMRE